jgi:thymidylate synthase (FAD)
MEKMLKYFEPKVRLISVTKPVIEDLNTPEELVAYTARVSNPGNQLNNETAHKLLRYCIKHAHWSIFEMVDATIEIECPRDIGRQILRHRTFTFQEFSQRYAEAQEYTWREPRLQDEKNRQNSISGVDHDTQRLWQDIQTDVLILAKKHYKWALDNGIAKEVARTILPEGLTMSRMYMKGSLRSWIHYCDLRSANGTQKEHMLIAQDCWKLIANEFPSVVQAVKE